jgi:hypothetical protein
MIMVQNGLARHAHFLEYSDAEDFHRKPGMFRGELACQKKL